MPRGGGFGLLQYTYLVGPVPKSHTNAASDIPASSNHSVVILGLLCKKRRALGKVHTNIELRDRDFDAQFRKVLHILLHGRRYFSDDEVALNAYTINGYALGLELFDEVEHSSRLRASTLDVEIVDLE